MNDANDSNPVRTAALGAGLLGSRLMDQLSEHQGMSLDAVVDLDEDALRRAGDRYDVPDASLYRDSERLFESESLDAAVVATPHAVHYEQLVPAIDDGWHVLCEKPLCTDLDDARYLVERAESSDGVLTVGYQRRLEAPFRLAREHVSEIGRPQFVTGEITQNWIDDARTTWRADPALSGGGFLYDTGSHVLDAVLWLVDARPVSVTADMTFDDSNGRVDRQASVNVSFENGAVANLSISAATPCTREHLHVWNDEGAAYIDGREWADRTVTFVDGDGAERSPDLSMRTEPTKVEAFYDAIRGESAPFVTAEEAMRVIAVTEAAYRSARSGRRIAVDV